MSDIKKTTECELRAIEDWAKKHGMLVNAEKTKLLCLSTNKKHMCSPICSNSGQLIERVDQARLLGITICANFSWTNHVNEVATKSARRIFALIQLRGAGCAKEIMWRIYYALIRN